MEKPEYISLTQNADGSNIITVMGQDTNAYGAEERIADQSTTICKIKVIDEVPPPTTAFSPRKKIAVITVGADKDGLLVGPTVQSVFDETETLELPLNQPPSTLTTSTSDSLQVFEHRLVLCL